MRDFDARLTLEDSAQVFSWKRIDGVYVSVVNGRVMTERDDDAFARDYFDDARDYTRLADECARFPAARRALTMLPGLRVLNQPPWEALLAFILSANNNVKRIRALVNALRECYGDRHEYRGEAIYGFPSAETLARVQPDELSANVRCGYRAPYLVKTAQMVAEGFALDSLKDMPIEDARKRLMTLKGVGGKVADCVLLFGCRHADAFPVDVWVERLMANWFGMKHMSREAIAREGRALFGANAGLVQQALFHAARAGLIDINMGGEV